ncbi:MAG: preprotein translocase subunit YajC [bacterium]
MIDFVSTAYAMGANGQGQGAQGNPILSILPLIIMFAVFYFLIILPQQKKAKKHKEMIDSIKKGDNVLTAGGIYGKVVGVAEKVIIIDVGDGVKVRVNKSFIQAVTGPDFEPGE